MKTVCSAALIMGAPRKFALPDVPTATTLSSDAWPAYVCIAAERDLALDEVNTNTVSQRGVAW
jgi:hypothetical protein